MGLHVKVTFFLSVQDCLQDFEHTLTLFTDLRCEPNEHRRETVIQYRSSEDPELAFSTKSTLDCWFTSCFMAFVFTDVRWRSDYSCFHCTFSVLMSRTNFFRGSGGGLKTRESPDSPKPADIPSFSHSRLQWSLQSNAPKQTHPWRHSIWPDPGNHRQPDPDLISAQVRPIKHSAADSFLFAAQTQTGSAPRITAFTGCSCLSNYHVYFHLWGVEPHTQTSFVSSHFSASPLIFLMKQKKKTRRPRQWCIFHFIFE